jgi:hypothetical protein
MSKHELQATPRFGGQGLRLGQAQSAPKSTLGAQTGQPIQMVRFDT